MDLGGAQNRARLRRKIDYGKGIRGEYLKMNPNFLTPITPTPRSNLRRRRARFWKLICFWFHLGIFGKLDPLACLGGGVSEIYPPKASVSTFLPP